MMSSVDLQRLADRIESLRGVDAHKWPFDDREEFGRRLCRLPSPNFLRIAACGGPDISETEYEIWNRLIIGAEYLEHAHQPDPADAIWK
jgi:hypothetical protein